MTDPKRRPPASPRAKKRAARTRREALLERIDDLETRVARLEDRAGIRSPPKIERPSLKTEPETRRCPGCYLRLPEKPGENCPWCGFVLAVVDGR